MCRAMLSKSLIQFSVDGRLYRTSLIARLVKNLPTMQETWVQSLGQEDPLEKEMAAHSSILAWRIPWTEEPGRLQSMGLQSRNDWATNVQGCTALRNASQVLFSFCGCCGASLTVQKVKNLPAMRETWLWSLGQVDPLKKGMATHSSILQWRVPTGRRPWWAAVHGVSKQSDTTGGLTLYLSVGNIASLGW